MSWHPQFRGPPWLIELLRSYDNCGSEAVTVAEHVDDVLCSGELDEPIEEALEQAVSSLDELILQATALRAQLEGERVDRYASD